MPAGKLLGATFRTTSSQEYLSYLLSFLLAGISQGNFIAGCVYRDIDGDAAVV